jgi:hypothetical protein
MVYFHTIGHVSHTSSVTLEFVSDEANLMASFNEALSELVPMSLNTAKLWESEVSADKDAILPIEPWFLNVTIVMLPRSIAPRLLLLEFWDIS